MHDLYSLVFLSVHWGSEWVLDTGSCLHSALSAFIFHQQVSDLPSYLFRLLILSRGALNEAIWDCAFAGDSERALKAKAIMQ